MTRVKYHYGNLLTRGNSGWLERGIPVIPLLVSGAHMPVEEELPTSLRKLVYRNGISIRPDPDFRNDMKRLISALEQYLRQVQRA